jgi:hypothetical protein
MDPKGQAGMSTISKGLCGGTGQGCTVLSARYSLEYADGKVATPETGVYIHHFVSFDVSKTAQNPIGQCGGGKGSLPMAEFADRGEDSGDTATTFVHADRSVPGGFHMGGNDKLMLQYDLVNYENTSKQLYIVLDYEYLPGIVGKDRTATLKTVQGCGVGGPKINTNGPSVTEGKPMPVLADGTIIWARGHLHSGGEKMILYQNGKVVCESLPTYNSDGVITNMSLCPKPIPIKKGDTLSVSSVYNVAKYPLRKSTDGHGSAHTAIGGSDVMGMMAMTYERA